MNSEACKSLRNRVEASKKKPGVYTFSASDVEVVLNELAKVESSWNAQEQDILRRIEENARLHGRIKALELELKDANSRHEAEVNRLTEENAALIVSNQDFTPPPPPPKPPKSAPANCGHCRHGCTLVVFTICRRNPAFQTHWRWSTCGEWRLK